ncbi:LysR family transcriptional regulator [Alkalimonas collagenimarina]|uniref:LysR family transcriptional regulator n=1 Tax=Alkalimonas collagenimarina TaxID=400390 RepID=A0ABT9H036_9GAMM|nr:LysR family transcriptional regulator [Alkalimonas collagenimarina]MDP4536305.1 LysR family transcriptional regulator [Alkalimonas collagenimarina]
MQDLNDLYYFVQVVEHQGFAAAGRALGIAKSKLSRRIALLEERLGVRLIQRSSRHFLITDVGQHYLAHCRAMLVEAEAAQQAIDAVRAEPCGTIRLTCPVGLLHFHVGAMLAEFMRLYPKVNVQLEATNRRVDLLAEGVDLALRVRPLPLEDSDLMLRILSDRGQCLVASPELVQQQGGLPQQVGDLLAWPSLSRANPQEHHEWCLQHADGRLQKLAFQPRYTTSDMLTLKTAALAGVGVVQLPLLMLQQELAAGSLIHLLPEWEPRREVIHLVFPSRRGMLPAIRALIDFLVERYARIMED